MKERRSRGGPMCPPEKRIKIGMFSLMVFLILSSFFSFSADSAMGFKVEATVDKNEIAVGDTIKYDIKIESDKDIEVDIPSLWQNLEKVEVIDSGKNERGLFGNKKINYWYNLENFNTENFLIPKVSVKYRRKADKDWQVIETDEIKIEVKSLLTSQDSDIKDIKGPLGPKSNLFLLFLFLAFLSVIGLWLFLYKKYFLKKEEDIEIKEPAHVIALRKLNLLKNKNFPRLGKIEEYYVELSGIVRFYIEERFTIRAPEMTTEEFLYNLKGRTTLSPEQKSMLKDFLSSTDKVKFARFQPKEEEIVESFDIAYKFVEDTKEQMAND